MAKAQLIITLEDDNRVSVSGPIDDKIAAYGMLGVAYDAVKDFNDKRAAAQRIAVVPAGAILPPN